MTGLYKEGMTWHPQPLPFLGMFLNCLPLGLIRFLLCHDDIGTPPKPW